MDKDDMYYRAMLSRDYRFDGKFFVGVKTTGIYCRPICPAKPKRENVEFFSNALSAEKAGYRPCLRCHPEFSPESTGWAGKSALVQRALSLISQNAMFERDIEAFADKLGVSSRHLRRLFDEEVGLSPKKISDHHRLNFARKLTIDTNLDLTTIALSSGFLSLRRFNDAFKKRYKVAPRTLRKNKLPMKEHEYTLHLSYRPPFDWETLLHYYSIHRIPFIEEVTDTYYKRHFKIGSSLGHVILQNDPDKGQIELKVYTQDPKILFTLSNRVQKMLDLNSDPILIRNQFGSNPFLKELWNEFPGLRIGKGWDPFEIAIGTILGQVVSVKQASHLMGELVKQYGEKVKHPITEEEALLFPSPEVLMNASLDEIKTTTSRKQAIRELSKKVHAGLITFHEYQDPETFKKELRKIPGIGAWSSEYIALRALGDTNAFPKDDLIIKRALNSTSHHYDLSQLEPWKGYLAIYLWKKYAGTHTKPKGKK